MTGLPLTLSGCLFSIRRCSSSTPTRVGLGAQASDWTKPNSDRTVIEPDPSLTGFQFFCPDPTPTQSTRAEALSLCCPVMQFLLPWLQLTCYRVCMIRYICTIYTRKKSNQYVKKDRKNPESAHCLNFFGAQTQTKVSLSDCPCWAWVS